MGVSDDQLQQASLTRSKEKKLAIDVCVIHFTLIKSMPCGMQRIEEAKLVTAGQDFPPNFANKTK